MNRLALALLAFTLSVASASAQDVTNPTPPSSINGAYNSAAPTCVDGHGCWLQTDANGNLKVNNAGTPSGTQDVNLKQVGGSTVTAVTAGADAASNTATGLQTYTRPSWWNGATWDRAPGDVTNGAFVNVKTSVLPTLAATSTKQSDGSQKSQVVDGSGNVIGATSNALDINIKSGSSGLPTGASSAANQTATQAPVAPATATATKSDLVGCQATSAAINPTTGQQAAVDCDLNNNLLVSNGGAPNFTTAQVSVTTSNTAAVAARALRRSVTITNITGTQQVFCSGTTATTANGQLIPAVVGASFTTSTTAAINCIAATSAQTVSVAEIY